MGFSVREKFVVYEFTGPVLTVSGSARLTIAPSVAVICEIPAATPVARPVFAPMVAIVALDEAHVTVVVMSFVEPSLYVPVAINCCVCAGLIDGFNGETAIDCSVTAFAVRVLPGLTTVPCVAVICVVPGLTPVAKPKAASTVATVGFEDAQATLVVMFLLLPSL